MPRATADDWTSLLKLVCILLSGAFVLALIAIYAIGGTDLLRFALAQLFTWKGVGEALTIIVGITSVTWVRHQMWFRDEPPPMWFRGSLWVNIAELFVLVAVILAGIWALLRFAPPQPR